MCYWFEFVHAYSPLAEFFTTPTAIRILIWTSHQFWTFK